MLHVCTVSDEDAPGYAAAINADPPKREIELREAVMALWSVAQLTKDIHPGMRKIRNLACLTRYGLTVWSRRRKTPMDVNKMIADWKAVVVTLCTAHDKEAIDAAEYRMDELLSPILAAPVKELRAFYTGLSKALEDDQAVPFFIWSIFSAWGEAVVEPASDDAKIKRLRRKLAGEIADMVDADIQPDIAAAVAGALMWRDPETLEEIKSDLKAGAKPRLRGRESCLFLVTKAKGGKEHTVML